MKNPLLACLFVSIAFAAPVRAGLTPGARHFTGQVKIPFSQPTTCFVEILYSADLGRMDVRSVNSLPHLSAQGEVIWIALGPYSAAYLPARALYRYQDPAPGALVKDLVVNTQGQLTPVKSAVLYWHAEAGHHDPIVCENLSEARTEAELNAVTEAFANFDRLKP